MLGHSSLVPNLERFKAQTTLFPGSAQVLPRDFSTSASKISPSIPRANNSRGWELLSLDYSRERMHSPLIPIIIFFYVLETICLNGSFLSFQPTFSFISWLDKHVTSHFVWRLPKINTFLGISVPKHIFPSQFGNSLYEQTQNRMGHVVHWGASAMEFTPD